MRIENATDARLFVAQWVASHGIVRQGILGEVISGLRKCLAIMVGAPTRYPECDRMDMREAIDYLTSADWSDRRVCQSTF